MTSVVYVLHAHVNSGGTNEIRGLQKHLSSIVCLGRVAGAGRDVVCVCVCVLSLIHI